MKKQSKLITVLFLAALFAACGGSTTETNTANTNAGNTAKMPVNTAPSIAANAGTAPTPIVAPTVNASADANAPCNVYLAYHMARVKNDEAGLRKTLTQASIRQLEAEAREDGEKTIVGSLNAYSSPSPKAPACGGNVQGDAAVLQTRDAETGVVTMLRALKENGDWKLDLLSVTLK